MSNQTNQVDRGAIGMSNVPHHLILKFQIGRHSLTFLSLSVVGMVTHYGNPSTQLSVLFLVVGWVVEICVTHYFLLREASRDQPDSEFVSAEVQL